MAFFLIGCDSPKSTENIELDQFSFNAFVDYFPATGEGYARVDIDYDPSFLESSMPLSLGEGDVFYISSGANTIAIAGSTLSAPMIVDPASELSVDFQRNGESIRKITLSVDVGLLPSIESDVSNLSSNTRQLTASLDYGVSLPHEIDAGFSFGYGSKLNRCYSADTGFDEIGESSSLPRRGFSSPEMFISSPIEVANSNPRTNVDSLIATQFKDLLSSEFYEYCESQLYSFVSFAKLFDLESGQTYVADYASYSEEGEFNGSLSVRLVSEPVALQIDRSAILD